MNEKKTSPIFDQYLLFGNKIANDDKFLFGGYCREIEDILQKSIDPERVKNALKEEKEAFYKAFIVKGKREGFLDECIDRVPENLKEYRGPVEAPYRSETAGAMITRSDALYFLEEKIKKFPDEAAEAILTEIVFAQKVLAQSYIRSQKTIIIEEFEQLYRQIYHLSPDQELPEQAEKLLDGLGQIIEKRIQDFSIPINKADE